MVLKLYLLVKKEELKMSNKSYKLIYKAKSNLSIVNDEFIYDTKEAVLTISERKNGFDTSVPEFSLNYLYGLDIEYKNKSAVSLERAKENAKRTLEKLLFLLGIQHGVVIKELTLLAVYKNNKQISASNSITLRDVSEFTIQLGEHEKEELVNLMNDGNNDSFVLNNKWLKQYNNILYTENSVGNYIGMYSLLQKLCSVGNDDGQRHVENFIKKQPNFDTNLEIVERVTTRGNTVVETIYTCLRNEVSHIKTDTEYNNIIEKMSQYYPKLLEIVVRAIREKSGSKTTN